MKGFFLKTFMTLMVALIAAPLSVAHAESGVFSVLDYDVRYEIEGGELIVMDLDVDFAALTVEIISLEDGFIELVVPRGLFDSKFSETEDDIFYVIIDGTESHYLEITSTEFHRTLIVPFVSGDEQIDIFGTDVLTSPPSISETMDEKQIIDTKTKDTVSEKGGGCLIATATFGTELAPQVQMLREIRDNTLLQTESGAAFMDSFNAVYYSFSPGISDLQRQNPLFNGAVKLAITPLITSLSILNYVEISSEAEMLGYGISLILLNAGMYFAAPAVVAIKLKKKL